MDWIMAAIETTTEGIEPICGRLYTLGVTGTEIEDAADFNDFLENDTKYWDYIDESLLYKKTAPTCVKVYLTDDEHGRAQLSAIRQSMTELAALDGEGRFGTLTVSLTNMQEQDWAENWKKYYKPLKVGEKILIKPEWEDLADDEGRTVFHINPGMSFGTGTHESTQLCLESLERHINKDDSVLDLGCGSGILSIVALLLGAGCATAVDIDPNAVKIAKENAAKNGITEDRYTALAADILSDEAARSRIAAQQYDLVLANIVADVIIALAPFARSVIKPGGTFITSGIILERKADVTGALEAAGFTIQAVCDKREWCSVTAIG